MDRTKIYLILLLILTFTANSQSKYKFGARTGVDLLLTKNEPNVFDIAIYPAIPLKAGVFVRRESESYDFQLAFSYGRQKFSKSYNINYKYTKDYKFDEFYTDGYWDLEANIIKKTTSNFKPFLGIGTVYKRNPGYFAPTIYEDKDGIELLATEEISNDKKFNFYINTGVSYLLKTKFIDIEPRLSIGYTFANRDITDVNFYDNSNATLSYRKLFYSFSFNFVLR